MTQQSTFEHNRTRYTVTETFASNTPEEMRRRLWERLLQIMRKKMAETG